MRKAEAQRSRYRWCGERVVIPEKGNGPQDSQRRVNIYHPQSNEVLQSYPAAHHRSTVDSKFERPSKGTDGQGGLEGEDEEEGSGSGEESGGEIKDGGGKAKEWHPVSSARGRTGFEFTRAIL